MHRVSTFKYYLWLPGVNIAFAVNVQTPVYLSAFEIPISFQECIICRNYFVGNGPCCIMQ